MIDGFHKDAAKNFSAKGKLLAESLSPVSNLSSNSFFSGPSFHSIATWGDDDIFDFAPHSRKELGGRTIARYGVINGITVGLEGESYLDFSKLLKKIHETKQLRDFLSFETLSDLCFTWMMRYRHGNESTTLPDFLLQETKKSIKIHSIAIPIYELRLESPKCLGRVELRPISSSDIDKWCTDILSLLNQSLKNNFVRSKTNYERNIKGELLLSLK